MTHAHVALYVEGRRAGEAEGLHVGEHLRLEHSTLTPRATESADELIVDWTPGSKKSSINRTSATRLANS